MRRLSLILLLFASLSLFAQGRKDFSNLETLYRTGKTSEAESLLGTLKPSKDEERALVQYYTALLKKNQAEALTLLNACANAYPQTPHGQLAMLEAAKFYILDRDMQKAQALLRRINSADIVERFYWSAVVFYWLDDFASAIANAENYMRLSPNGKEAENALHLISDAYIGQRKYQSAVSSLSKVSRLKDYDKQYYFYKLGLAHELNQNAREALNAYREGYELDKYSQNAFNIEEHLFAMRSRAPSLDLSFLYPYSPLEIKPEVAADSTKGLPQSLVDSHGTVPPIPDLPPIDQNQAIKLPAKPTQGFFLQAGRFSVEGNAERLSRGIREMKLPASYYEDKSQAQTTWVVLAGPFQTSEDTDRARIRLTNSEINSFIVQY
jgi:tetratricopeptide (TPR) repeat protein